MPDDLDALGAQYRDARDAIGTHRRKQAKAELAWAAARGKHPPGHPAIGKAGAKVDRAVADVQWCRAVTVAAGEAYKGCTFAEAVERNDANRGAVAAARQRALAALEQPPERD